MHCLFWNEEKQNQFYRATHNWLDSAELTPNMKAVFNNYDVLEGDGAKVLPQTKKQGRKSDCSFDVVTLSHFSFSKRCC